MIDTVKSGKRQLCDISNINVFASVVASLFKGGIQFNDATTVYQASLWIQSVKLPK